LKPQSACGEVAVQIRRHVHEDDAVRLVRCLEASLEEREVLLAGPACALRRSGSPDLDLAGDARLGMDGDEAGVPVGELEVHGAVDARERVPAFPVVQVVVADDADVGDRQAPTSRR
jgi:hypothetical protein